MRRWIVAGSARSGYEMGVRFAKNASDVTSSGPLSGLGSEAFFVWTKREYDAGGTLNSAFAYQVSALGGSIDLHLTLSVAAITEAVATITATVAAPPSKTSAAAATFPTPPIPKPPPRCAKSRRPQRTQTARPASPDEYPTLPNTLWYKRSGERTHF